MQTLLYALIAILTFVFSEIYSSQSEIVGKLGFIFLNCFTILRHTRYRIRDAGILPEFLKNTTSEVVSGLLSIILIAGIMFGFI